MKKTLLISTFIAATSLATADWQLQWQVDGLATPESAIQDLQRQKIYVSNMNGGATERNGLGSISWVSLDGSEQGANWITGLNAPKGMAIVDTILYVADLDVLVAIDLDSNQVEAKYPATGSVLLNDVTSDNKGNIYVSDIFTNAIYKLESGQFELWLKSDELQSPNGLAFADNHLYVGNWGKNPDANFNTQVPGQIQRINLANKQISTLADAEFSANIDGISPYENGWLVNDFMTGELTELNSQGKVVSTTQLPLSSADTSYANGLLLVPVMFEGKLQAYQKP